ncbi:hypothetical protein [Ginsengibacter hankyongi]|uniref:hypothetical protein n=1 Tax=Ginsengibacter hankyongi TaxID=2607284 RepID=UPI001929786B|nr:hypothetical protein [Ginsengibacter hankyongi]
MKKVFLNFLLGQPLIIFAQNATIKINVTKPIGHIDPKIFSVFMEPIHFNGRLRLL